MLRFLRDHMQATAACDVFSVPSMAFRNSHVIVALHRSSGRILHTNVTEHPTAEWTAQQLVEASIEFLGATLRHRYRSTG